MTTLCRSTDVPYQPESQKPSPRKDHMKTFRTVLALVAILLFAVTPTFAQTIPNYEKPAQAVTSTAATITPTASIGRVASVTVRNDGAVAFYVDIGRTAVAGSTTAKKVAPCAAIKMNLGPTNTLSYISVITASGTSTANVSFDYLQGTPNVYPDLADRFQDLDNFGCTTDTGLTTVNGASMLPFANSELITLSTSGATTDSTADLLPANAIIDAVVCRVTTTITTATDWGISDPTTSLRFSAVNATMTAGATTVGLKHMFGVVSTTATGPTQAAAAKLRITTTGTPGAGAVRCTVFGRVATAPAS